MVLYWHKNPKDRFIILSNLDKFFILSKANTQENTTPSKTSSNFGLLTLVSPISDLGLLLPIDFEPFIKTFIKMTKNQDSFTVSTTVREKAFNNLLNARNPYLYYGNSHIEYYYFCQNSKDHLKVAGAKNYRWVPFISYFLKKRSLFTSNSTKVGLNRTV